MVVSVPHLIANGGGSIICTSSTAGIKGLPFLAPYVAAKHGVVGIAKTMANELAAHSIRVNTVHPTGVDTPMGPASAASSRCSKASRTSARSS
jgi:NAD(P)-dependent dehydrogenase (short-subunit alcohol dehydrogenase family)